MYPCLVGKAAKVGRDDASGVTHSTSQALFESKSWKKCRQAAKIWQHFGIKEPVRTTKLKNKIEKGACQCSQNFERRTSYL